MPRHTAKSSLVTSDSAHVPLPLPATDQSFQSDSWLGLLASGFFAVDRFRVCKPNSKGGPGRAL